MENKKEKIIRYWSMFGYKLGRMEFIWDKSIPETEQEFDKALNELLFMLGDSFIPSLESYKDFSSQILLYYQREDIYIYSYILIGICLQRYQLSLAVPDKNKKELIELAKSALSGIPRSVVPDKDFLFSTIVSCKNALLPEICNKIIESIDLMFDPEESNMSITSHELYDDHKYVFICYSTKDSDIIEIIKKQLKDNNICFWIAPDSIPVGSEYTEMIVDAIENSSVVLLVLSEHSQKSIWVPKELDIAISADKVIIPVHIDKSTLNKKMKFRLSNSQIAEASEDFTQKFSCIISTIKSVLKGKL